MRLSLAVMLVLLLGMLGCLAGPGATPDATVAPALSVSIWGEVPTQCA